MQYLFFSEEADRPNHTLQQEADVHLCVPHALHPSPPTAQTLECYVLGTEGNGTEPCLPRTHDPAESNKSEKGQCGAGAGVAPLGQEGWC